MISAYTAARSVGRRVQFVHTAQRGRKDSGGILQGLDPEDPNRALVEFDYGRGHISHPLLDLLVFEEDRTPA